MTQYSFQQLKDLWIQAGGSPTFADMAAAVAMAESGGRSDAVNNNNNDGSIDRGLWQINSVHGKQSTFDPMNNARAAVGISNGGTNWRPWCVAYANGGCSGEFMGPGSPVLKFLPGGSATGNVPSAGNLAPIAASTTPVGLAALFGSLLGAKIADLPTLQGILEKIGKKVWQYVYWYALWVGGAILMVIGVILLILSSKFASKVGQVGVEAGKAYAGGFLSTKGAVAALPKESPAEPAPAPAPTPAPPAKPEPLLPLPDAERRRGLSMWDDDTRASLEPPPRKRPLKRKARVDYRPRHSAGDE